MGVFIQIPAVAAGTWREGVADEASLPASGNALYDARVSLDDESIFIWTGSAWVGVGGGGGGVDTVGAFNASAQANGASISGTTITFGPADGSTPGMVSTGAQTWAGVKTLSSAPILSSLTASKPVFSDGSKAMTSTGTVPIANGGTNSVAALNNNRIIISSGSAIVENAAITAARMMYSDSNGIPAASTWIYDSANGNLTVPTSTSIGLNGQLRFGAAGTFISTDENSTGRMHFRVPANGRVSWAEDGNTLYLAFQPGDKYIDIGFYDGTKIFNLLKSVGKATSIKGNVPTDLYDNITAVGNVGVGTDDLQSVTVASKVLATTKDALEILSWGTFANNANAKAVDLLIGGGSVASIPSAIYTDVTWSIRTRFIDTGSSTQKYISWISVGGAVPYMNVVSGTTAITDTATIVCKTTGAGTDNDDIVSREIFIANRPAVIN